MRMNICIFNLLFDDAASETKSTQLRIHSVAYPGILFWGRGVQQIQLRTEDGGNGDMGAVAP